MIENVFGYIRDLTEHKQRLFDVLFDIPSTPNQSQSSSSLTPIEEIKGSENQLININQDLVRQGYARYDDVYAHKYKRRELEEYIEAENHARETHKESLLYDDFHDKEDENR
ncbi:MAG: hypothetical protein EZS28_004071 [Streblomastix strix]|uniref:TNase-like domain-containing protein n=1 Tax=Streblomastix strix TaxID=222440 RepID=A0A5J4WZ72_9EUKA|nr:MAG: hypothetical protein EZS28_004071 [Streblomastix strix]